MFPTNFYRLLERDVFDTEEAVKGEVDLEDDADVGE